MPFVFIHGVAVRDQGALPGIEKMLRYYVAPVFASADPNGVQVFSGFWGDLGATFAWNEASLPGAAPAGIGAQGTPIPPPAPNATAAATTLASYGDTLLAQRSRELGPLPTGARPGGVAPIVSADEASDLFTAALAAPSEPTLGPGALAAAAASVDFATAAIALDEAIREKAGGNPLTLDDATIADIESRARKRLLAPGVTAQGSELAAQGVVGDVAQRIGDAVQAARDAAGNMTARALIGLRQPLNHLVTMFTGDVFTYLERRDEMPPNASIIGRVTEALVAAREAATKKPEPIVVLTHSMGGQLLYDVITYYLDKLKLDVEISFWATAASQVGLFEEMKLFKASSPAFSKAHGNKAPSPIGKHLRYWWNVFDPADFLSYTAAPIFDGVREARFMSDTSTLQAHGAYLVMPRFYRMFADELKVALKATGGKG